MCTINLITTKFIVEANRNKSTFVQTQATLYICHLGLLIDGSLVVAST